MTTRYMNLPFGFQGTDAERAKVTIPSPDVAGITRRTTHFSFDLLNSQGFQTGALPADAASVGTLTDVANRVLTSDRRPSGLTGVVTGIANNSGQPILYESTGGAGASGLIRNGESTASALRVQQEGVTANAMGHPKSEGFKDFAFSIWFKPDIMNYWSLAGCSNNNNGSEQYKYWGLECLGGGGFIESSSSRAIPGVVAGSWSHVLLHYRYDAPAIYLRSFVNGDEVNTSLAATAITPTTVDQDAAPNTNTRLLIGSNYRDTCFKGLIARCDRIFTGVSGDSLDPAVLAKQDYLANRLRISGL